MNFLKFFWSTLALSFCINLALPRAGLAAYGLVAGGNDGQEGTGGYAFFLGGGMGYRYQTLTASSASTYSGFGWSGEAGYDLGFSSGLGIGISGFYENLVLQNTAKSATIFESLTGTIFGGVVSVGYKALSFGYGIGRISSTVDTFSTQAASVSSTYAGTLSVASASLKARLSGLMGTLLSGRYEFGTIGGTKLSNLSFNVNLMFCLPVR